jgi:signal transduction histidine kinase/ligand-binding sensor domain-containing protein
VRLARSWIRLLNLVFLACVQTASSSATVFTNTPHFFTRLWQVEEGLPQNKVTAVVQAQDGYLWIGTYSGLARFDGVAFTIFDDQNTPEMRSSRVTALFESRDGTLWVGCENGTLTKFKNGKFSSENIRASEGEKIASIVSDKDGDIWLVTSSGIVIRARDGFELSPERGVAPGLLGVACDTSGKIWVARDGKLSAVEHGQLTCVQSTWAYTNAYVQGICAAGDGSLWVAHDGVVQKWNGEKWTEDLGRPAWAMSALTSFIETKEGMLVAGTSDHGLFILFPGSKLPAVEISSVGQTEAGWIISLLQDREGNVWAGSGGKGLISIRPNHIQTIEPPNGWRGRAVLSVFPGSAGELWVGTEGAGLYHYANGDWENFGFTNGIGNGYIWSTAQDLEGNIFAGTWGGGLFMRDGARFKFAPGLEKLRSPVAALLPARDGGLWVGTGNGLLRWREDGQTNWIEDGKSLRAVRAIAELTNGVVWFGTAGNGLGCLQQGKIRQFRLSDGLPSDYIECLHFDETGALWLGTFGGGLCRLKNGKFSTINSKQGLPNSIIGHIEDDGHGYFWMSSHGGILRASKTALNDCADGKIKSVSFLSYGVNDGMPTIECSEGLQPSGCQTTDGRLYFPTTKGLVMVSPGELRFNPEPPPMALEELRINGKAVNLAASLKIPPGGNHLEFRYAALSFVAPEKVQFKCRIEGLEKDWTDMETKRVANYNFVPPGNYKFHVIACNNDGVWNETGISLPFELLPHFWQTWWFHFFSGLFGVCIAGGLVWLDARRRMRRRLEKLERERAVERERTRIAKDIHDDLGASLTRITMLSQSARGEAQLPEPVTNNLDRIFATARELTRAMDEIVWAVNPRHDRLDSLANYLSRFAQEYLSVAEIRCRLDVPLQLPSLPVSAEIRHNLFLAFKEVLHNVVKHASANETRMELKLDPSGLILSVVDNGRGFDVGREHFPSRTDRIAPGNGLLNMKRRLTEIGGACEICSQPGQGTTVTFTVPLSVSTSAVS